MFDLDQAILQWRRQLSASGLASAEILDELESHLREEIERQLAAGLTAEEAFHLSVARLGEPSLLRREFTRARKRGSFSQARAGLKLALTGLLAIALIMAALPLLGIHLSLAEQGQGIALLTLLFLCVWLWKFGRVDPTAPINLKCFTVGARQSLELARAQAARMHHDFIGTEHSLLGLMEEGVVARVFQRLRVDREMIQREVERFVPLGSPKQIAYDLPSTPRLRRALYLAAQEARALSQTEVGSEHILLGLVKEGEGVAAIVLKNLGVQLEDLRREVLKEMGP
jgi:hypothetical protein